MALYQYRPVGNGFGTDHPIPELPFVDDSRIPLDDRFAIEAIGRRKAEDMWGREDLVRGSDEGWVAFTTDPERRDLAWCVRWHPTHGRSVVVYRDEDISSVHTVLCWAQRGAALLFRNGGYWWDGTTWYRPGQIWDGASEEYVRREVPAATTVSAADLVEEGDPGRGRVLTIGDVEVDGSAPGNWLDDLAVWAERRDEDQRPLAQCVVRLSAPELSGDQLVGAGGMAEIAGIAASTLRAYISRGEEEVPLPQAVVNGRNVWARTVAGEWAEQRRRSPEQVTASVSTAHNASKHPAGITALRDRFARDFSVTLWEHPGMRKRWAMRWRNKAAVDEVAEDLAWTVAGSIDQIVPTEPLAATIHHAVLDEFTTGQQLTRTLKGADAEAPFYGIAPPVGRMLGWLVRHHPTAANQTINDIIGDAYRRLDIPDDVSEQSIRTSLALDGNLDEDALEDFLSRVFAPAEPAEE